MRSIRADSTLRPVGTVSRTGSRATDTTPTVTARVGLGLVLLTMLLIVGCFGKSGHSYKLYPGPVLLPEELAVVKFGKGATLMRVAGMPVHKKDYESIELLPGSYLILWGVGPSASVTANSDESDGLFASVNADLEAGHVYTVNSQQPILGGSAMRWWFTDTTTGIELASNLAR
jgi:hypothetical protein